MYSWGNTEFGQLGHGELCCSPAKIEVGGAEVLKNTLPYLACPYLLYTNLFKFNCDGGF